jgi:hypothetical protein
VKGLTRVIKDIGLNWNTRTTVPSLVDKIGELPSLVSSILLIGCNFDAANSKMTIRRDDDKARSGLRSITVT